jgi:hypothetical protein
MRNLQLKGGRFLPPFEDATMTTDPTPKFVRVLSQSIPYAPVSIFCGVIDSCVEECHADISS